MQNGRKSYLGNGIGLSGGEGGRPQSPPRGGLDGEGHRRGASEAFLEGEEATSVRLVLTFASHWWFEACDGSFKGAEWGKCFFSESVELWYKVNYWSARMCTFGCLFRYSNYCLWYGIFSCCNGNFADERNSYIITIIMHFTHYYIFKELSVAWFFSLFQVLTILPNRL